MWRAAWTVVLVSACSFQAGTPGNGTGDGGGSGGGQDGSGSDAAPMRFCAGSGGLQFCADPPAGAVTLEGTLDSQVTGGNDCTTIANNTCFVVGTSIGMSGDVRVKGGNVVVLLAMTTITIDHELDASG